MSLTVKGTGAAFDGGRRRLERVGLATATELAADAERFIVEQMKKEGHTDTDLTNQNIKAHPARMVAPGLARARVTVAPVAQVPALILEEGRKPGKGVSRAAREGRLAKWVTRKIPGFVARLRAEAEQASMQATGKKRPAGKAADRQAAAVRQAVFLIARKIQKQGLKGYHYFRRARIHMQNRMGATYRRILARVK